MGLKSASRFYSRQAVVCLSVNTYVQSTIFDNYSLPEGFDFCAAISVTENAGSVISETKEGFIAYRDQTIDHAQI